MEKSDMSKIRIKYGDVEIEFEGSEKFIKSEITTYFNSLITPIGTTTKAENPIIPTPIKKGQQHKIISNLSVSTASSKLGCKSGRDLVIAATAALHFGHNKETFTRDEILKEMKTATAYFKKNYSNNLFGFINSLVKAGKLLHISGNTYSLHADTISDLRGKLAN